MREEGRNPALGWILLAVGIVVVLLIIAASVLQRPAPPGAKIVNEPLPADHPVGPCYECHKGMATGEQIQSKRVPEPHPAEKCSECHEGYLADPGSSQPVTALPPPGGSP